MKASVESRAAISTLAVAEVVVTPYRTLPASRFFLFLQLRDHAEIFEGCCITFHFPVRRQLAQQAAHNFSAAGLGEGLSKANVIWLSEGPVFFCYPFRTLTFQFTVDPAPPSHLHNPVN